MPTDAQLLGYLDELLPIAELTQIESQLRGSPELRERLARLSAQRDSGVHAVGDIWRRERLTCLTRAQLGSYLLGAMTDEEIEYAEFHLRDVGCRYCQANLADLRSQQSDTTGQVTKRRAKFFQTSVGRVGRK
ncbi:MAG: hypothetical protein JNM18_15980 [Planctomycetaceae bacterium]|nr:hypothetical protein [Planctomycetaceae bacterium]